MNQRDALSIAHNVPVQRRRPDLRALALFYHRPRLLGDFLAMKLYVKSHSGGWHNLMSYSWLYYSALL
jgi:hypothetical protein